MRKEKGITLITLIITIIILIILAGVAISITVGENSLLSKAKEAKEKYTVETIREKVETGIMNIEIEEIALGNKVTIDLVLQKLLEDGTFETIDKDEDIGNIGEYEVKLKYNEEEKVVIEYIEKATGVRVTYTLDPVGYTNGDKVSILLTVKGKVKSITKPDGLVIYPENEVLAIDYEVTANGTYPFIIEDEEGNKKEKNVIVDTIDRLAPNDFEITALNEGIGMEIAVNATDAESDGISVKSGIEKYEYFVKGKDDDEYTKNEIKNLASGTYEVYAIAYDRAGNSKQSNTITIKTGLYKLKVGDYIKYDTGTDIGENGVITCRVLYEADSEYGLQIISDKNVVEELVLGGTDWKTGKSAYNNAIKTLNDEAEKYLNEIYAVDARCVGSLPSTSSSGYFIEKDKGTTTTVTLTFKPEGWTTRNSGCYDLDINYMSDYNTMNYANLRVTEEKYWLASRSVHDGGNYFHFLIKNINLIGELQVGNGAGTILCRANQSYESSGHSSEGIGLRACFSLRTDIKITGGDGLSEETAYILGI